MKVLCVADHVDPFIYSSGLKARYSDVDLVISAGDLRFDYYDFIISVLNKPLYFVNGNHHVPQRQRESAFEGLKVNGSRWEAFGGATRLEGRVRRVKGLLLAGLGGSIWYNGGENQYSDLRMYLNIVTLLPRLLWNRVFHGRYLDILVTHSPPYGINDLPDRCHTGFRSFLWFMRAFRPRYLVHGHVHLYDRNAAREAVYGQTRVINAYDHVIIQLETTR
jgi:uncharacterized protein